MKKTSSPFTAVIVATIIVTPVTFADSPNKEHREVEKAQMKEQRKRDKRYRELEREEMKKERRKK